MAEERAQRRLAAILAADVVGCSRLMGCDEVGTLAALKERRKEVLEPLTAAYRTQFSHAMKEARRVVGAGPYWGLEPTGKCIEIQKISIFRCAGGRVVEQWCIFDELARLQQLGVHPAYLRRMLKL